MTKKVQNKVNPTVILLLVLGILIGVALSNGYWYWTKTKNYQPMDQLSQDISKYINANIFQNQIQTEVKEAEVIGQNLIKFKLNIPNRGEFTSYATRDGRFLFPEGVDMLEKKDQTPPTDNTNAGADSQDASAPAQATDSGEQQPSK